MTRQTRSNDWGFPRWRGYGSERKAARVRLCDREGCDSPGDRPAPKSPNSPERWWFCEVHAAEYNRNWNYFEGLSAEDAAAREAEERKAAATAEAERARDHAENAEQAALTADPEQRRATVSGATDVP